MEFSDDELREHLDKTMEHLGGWSYASVADEINRRAAVRQTEQSIEIGGEIRDLTSEVRDLTREVRDLTRETGKLSWITIGIGAVAAVVAIIALLT